jgi:hypothetical protein
LLKASCTYLSLSKSGTFGHPAVRIRVNSQSLRLVMCNKVICLTLHVHYINVNRAFFSGYIL